MSVQNNQQPQGGAHWGQRIEGINSQDFDLEDPYEQLSYQFVTGASNQPVYQVAPQRAVPMSHAAGAAAAPKKKAGKGSLLIIILLMVVGIGLLASSLVMMLHSQQEYQVGIDEYGDLAVNVTEDSSTGRPFVDFGALQAQNPEIVGWIQIPNTPVNYPVNQADNNEYYLEHTFLGQYNLCGTIFMDYRSWADLSDWNTVLYGHHLKNGEMFAAVAQYSNQYAFDTIEDIYYIDFTGTVHVLVPMCCIVISGYDVDAIQFGFNSQEEFSLYVQSLLDRSSAISPTANAWTTDHIYMLSTCSYGSDNERTILVCTDLDAAAGNGAVVDATPHLADIQDVAELVADSEEWTNEEWYGGVWY